jgi:hypothetical protein
LIAPSLEQTCYETAQLAHRDHVAVSRRIRVFRSARHGPLAARSNLRVTTGVSFLLTALVLNPIMVMMGLAFVLSVCSFVPAVTL